MTFMVIAAMAALLAIEAPGLARRRRWRELAAFLALWLLAGIAAALQTAGIELPNPWKPLLALSRLFLIPQ